MSDDARWGSSTAMGPSWSGYYKLEICGSERLGFPSWLYELYQRQSSRGMIFASSLFDNGYERRTSNNLAHCKLRHII